MSDDKQEKICALWDQLADFPASQIDEACRCLMQTVCDWIDADHAGWVGATRLLDGTAAASDLLSGWRAKTIVPLRPPTPQEAKLFSQLLKSQGHLPAMTSVSLTRHAGKFRVHRLRDGFIDFAAFKRSPNYQFLHVQTGVDDRLWVVFPVSQDAELYFVFDKHRTKDRFTIRNAKLAGDVIRGLKWFHRQLLCSHGLLVAQSPLTPTERQVVQLLLTDKSEKQIAAELSQSPLTTHGHVKEIFRKFGVQGRAGLMAIWLSHI